VWSWDEHKITIMHVQNGGGRNNRVYFFGLTAEGSLREHAQPHVSWILNFYADLGRTDIRIEDRSNVADCSLEGAIGIRIQRDLRCVPELDRWQVVLINIANDPDR